MERSIVPSKSEKIVKTEPIELLAKDIMKQYNQNPLGWNMLSDFKGNMLVLGPRDGYMLKLITISPQEQIGVGMRIDSFGEIRRLVKGIPSYGFRPLSKLQSKKLMSDFSNQKQNNIISEIMMKKPVPAVDLKKKRSRAVLRGPIITHPDLSTISKRQSELGLKLKIEAQKVFRKKYPKRDSIYA